MNRSLVRVVFAPVIALAVLMATNAVAQDADPFSNDPFAKRNRAKVAGPRIDITFLALDQDGNPVSGVEVRGHGLFKPLVTKKSGEAIWYTDESHLRDSAATLKGSIRFNVRPLEGSGIPLATKLIPVADLLKKKAVRFEMQPGVRVEGRVVGKQDHQPLQGVEVKAQFPKNATGRTRLSTLTDSEGYWSLTLPRTDSSVRLVASGVARGFDKHDLDWQASNHTRVIDIPSERSTVETLDFEIAQIPPLKVEVRDLSGRPVAGVHLCAYRKHWYNPKLVTWEEISESEETGAEGEATIYLKESDASAFLVAVADIGGERLEGRSELGIEKSGDRETVQLIVRPPSKISGLLLNDGKPAAGVPLVLYEAVEDGSGGWTTIGVRGEASTDRLGRYQFAAIDSVHYMVATKSRDENKAQTILHRTDQKVTQEPYAVPAVDLAAVTR